MTLHVSPLHGGFERLPDGSVRWLRRTPISSSLDVSEPTPTTGSDSESDVVKDSSGPGEAAGESSPPLQLSLFDVYTYPGDPSYTDGIDGLVMRDAD